MGPDDGRQGEGRRERRGATRESGDPIKTNNPDPSAPSRQATSNNTLNINDDLFTSVANLTISSAYHRIFMNTTFYDGLSYVQYGPVTYVLPNDIVEYYIDDAMTPLSQPAQFPGTWEAYYGVPAPYAPAGASTPVPRKQAVNSLMFRFDPPNDPSVRARKGGGGGGGRKALVWVWGRPLSLSANKGSPLFFFLHPIRSTEAASTYATSAKATREEENRGIS